MPFACDVMDPGENAAYAKFMRQEFSKEARAAWAQFAAAGFIARHATELSMKSVIGNQPEDTCRQVAGAADTLLAEYIKRFGPTE